MYKKYVTAWQTRIIHEFIFNQLVKLFTAPNSLSTSIGSSTGLFWCFLIIIGRIKNP